MVYIHILVFLSRTLQTVYLAYQVVFVFIMISVFLKARTPLGN